MIKYITYVSFFEGGAILEQNMKYRQQLIVGYQKEVVPLLRYLPWMEQHIGKLASTSYQNNGLSEHSVEFPVYDGTLMNFVKEISKTSLMERNYRYVYTRNHIRNHEDERMLISKAGIEDWNLLRGILSYYVLGGRTKAYLWSEAVKEQIFYNILCKMREIIEYWDRPLHV